jgi:beta-mannosidase
VLAQGNVTAHAPANSAVQAAHLSADVLGDGDRHQQFVWLRGTTGQVEDNRHFFAEIKDLARERPNVQVTWQQDGAALVARVSTDRYAYFTHLFVPQEGTRYSDNWFDLYPGTTREIRIWHPSGKPITPDRVEVNWR